jgi:hypothetical protein
LCCHCDRFPDCPCWTRAERLAATSVRFTFRVKFEFRLTSTSTLPPPQLQLPHTAAPTAMPTPNESAAAPNA